MKTLRSICGTDDVPSRAYLSRLFEVPIPGQEQAATQCCCPPSNALHFKKFRRDGVKIASEPATSLRGDIDLSLTGQHTDTYSPTILDGMPLNAAAIQQPITQETARDAPATCQTSRRHPRLPHSMPVRWDEGQGHIYVSRCRQEQTGVLSDVC